MQHTGRRRIRAIPAALTVGIALVLTGPTVALASARPAKPSVGSLHASSHTIGHAGGGITLSASVKRATRCTFASSRRLHGLPVSVSCSSGKVKRTLRLPANSGAASTSYRFKLTAHGPGGTSAPRYVTVSVLPPPPSATLSVSPDGLTSAGGTAVITATVQRSATCELSVSPAVAGLPATVPCAAGTTAKTVSHAVTLPALSGSAGAPYKFTLSVTGPGGSVDPSVTDTVWPAMTFAAPGPADPPEGYAASLSCPSSTNCTAIDMFGNVVSWNGTAWSAPRHVLPLTDGLVTGMTTAVSCPAASVCVAAGQTGATAVETDGTWSAGANSGVGASAISCASASLCVAIGGDQAAVYSAGTWSSPVFLAESSDSLESVSCAPGTSFCLATDLDGNSYSYTGTAWSAATQFDSNTLPDPVVSCASQDFCVAVDGAFQNDSGAAFTYNGTSWSAAVPVSSGHGLNSVSCPSATYCLATATDGGYYTLSAGAWSGEQLVGAGAYQAACASASPVACAVLSTDGDVEMLKGTTWTTTSSGLQIAGFTSSVSCPTASFCAAADQTGSIAFYNGSRWSVQSPPITAGSALVAISCPTASFCMAADDDHGTEGSNIYTWDGRSWDGKYQPGIFLTSVSCSSATFCVALGYLSTGVFVSTWNGDSWTAQTEIDSPAAVGQVSCASPDFCAAVDQNGDAMIFNGQSWSAPDPIDAGVVQPLATVSCPAPGFCTAMDGFGQAFDYTSAGWSTAIGVENSAGVTSVSCASESFCVAVDISGNVVTEYNGQWSAPQNIDPQSDSNFYGFTGVSCPTVAFCAAVDYDGNASLGTG